MNRHFHKRSTIILPHCDYRVEHFMVLTAQADRDSDLLEVGTSEAESVKEGIWPNGS